VKNSEKFQRRIGGAGRGSENSAWQRDAPPFDPPAQLPPFPRLNHFIEAAGKSQCFGGSTRFWSTFLNPKTAGVV
jgi:hypothetical protein